MRILHVTDCYLPQLGGIEMHVGDLATRQVAAGHQVTVLTRTPTTGSAPQGAVRVEVLRGNPLALGAGYDVSECAARNRVDVVHAHLSVVSPLAWAALRAQRSHPVVTTMHSVLPDSPDLLRAAMTLGALPSRNVRFTAVSEVAAQPWRRAFAGRMLVQVLPNGIDPEVWSGPHIPAPDGSFTVISVGRLARRKRVAQLVRMLAALRRDLSGQCDLRAVLVGDGRQLGPLRREVRRLGLQDVVEFTGVLSRTQIRDRLHRADVYVAPATLESFGIAALEARCAGVPVVAMAAGGAGEFVRDGREGFLVPDDAAMRRVVGRLALDPDLVRRIREHNLSTRPPMDWTRVIELHDQLYASARNLGPGSAVASPAQADAR